MAKIVPPLVFRKQAEYDGKYDAVSECELRPHETFKLLRAHALQQLYIICHANNGSLWKTKRRRGYHYFHVRDVHSHQLVAHVRRLSLRRSVKFHTVFSVSTHASPALSADRVWTRPRSIDKHAMSAAEISPSTLRVWHRDTYNQSHWLS